MEPLIDCCAGSAKGSAKMKKPSDFAKAKSDTVEGSLP
jgi:hypothetical protein